MNRPVIYLVLLGVLGFELAGCLTTEQMAPPVESLAPAAAWNEAQTAQLQRGRRIYLTRCAHCHAIEPINAYSEDEWHDTLVDMIDEAKLKSDDAAALRAYIVTARRLMPD